MAVPLSSLAKVSPRTSAASPVRLRQIAYEGMHCTALHCTALHCTALHCSLSGAALLVCVRSCHRARRRRGQVQFALEWAVLCMYVHESVRCVGSRTLRMALAISMRTFSAKRGGCAFSATVGACLKAADDEGLRSDPVRSAEPTASSAAVVCPPELLIVHETPRTVVLTQTAQPAAAAHALFTSGSSQQMGARHGVGRRTAAGTRARPSCGTGTSAARTGGPCRCRAATQGPRAAVCTRERSAAPAHLSTAMQCAMFLN